ncbi:MAG TPA: alpha-amylase family glycosyl hydrolase [Allosphingosinicella sp.]|jgi:glycosidase
MIGRALTAALAVAVSACATVPAQRPPASAPLTAEREVFYHIFTRSFRDGDGDLNGDLRGITDRLDYLQRLGVTSILLTPLYPSPFYHNYFATDFDGIDPEFGTMDDWRSLVAEVHRRGMKIYIDQEMQYVASGHPWWEEPLRDRGSRYADFILWDDKAAGVAEEGPFGIRVAKHFPGLRTGITTVNMKNPEVKAWFDRYYLSWVDPNGDGDFSDGVDGFRIDHMMDDLDNRHLLTDLFADFWRPLFAKLRARNPRLTFIAEQWDWGYGEDFLTRGDADYAFAFPLRTAIRALDKAKIEEAIRGTAAATPAGRHQLLFVENHDMNRLASDPGMTPERLRTAAGLAMLLQGTPLLYYGQELGMRGTTREAADDDSKDIGNREAMEWEASVEAPGHAHWYKGGGTPWTERFVRDHDGISVAEQERDPASLLAFYRRLLALRRTEPALTGAGQTVLAAPGPVLAVERGAGAGRLIIVANLSPAPAALPIQGEDLLGGGRPAQLRPWQLVLLRPD